MSLLADACVIIVFHGYGGQMMSEANMTAMASGDVFVSSIIVWEITRKVAFGALVRPGFQGSLSAWLRTVGYRPLPLGWDAAERADDLPMHHKDPMDRMLIATDLQRGLTIVTDAAAFDAYGGTTLW